MIKTVMDDLPIRNIAIKVTVQGEQFVRYLGNTDLAHLDGVVENGIKELRKDVAKSSERRKAEKLEV
jgi:hypothetical protein